MTSEVSLMVPSEEPLKTCYKNFLRPAITYNFTWESFNNCHASLESLFNLKMFSHNARLLYPSIRPYILNTNGSDLLSLSRCHIPLGPLLQYEQRLNALLRLVSTAVSSRPFLVFETTAYETFSCFLIHRCCNAQSSVHEPLLCSLY